MGKRSMGSGPMRRLALAAAGLAALVLATLASSPSEASACAGLIGSNGAVILGRTTTLAAYHDGVEHYVTSFEFQGGGGEFGTLIPLPAVPTKVERGGAWTLQRLQLETQPQRVFAESALAPAADGAGAKVLLETRIDALDLTVLEGGGPAVAEWAQEHGFRLSPDAPEVLDFYAQQSPIFLAAVFDGEAAAARGQQIGDGTPVHLTIPTGHAWVPLRILGLGKQPADLVEADVFLLTDDEPDLSARPGSGLTLSHSQRATDALLADLRADDGMTWVPQSAWLTKIEINARAGDLLFDLAVDAPAGDAEETAPRVGIEPRPVADGAGAAAGTAVEGSAGPPPWAVAVAVGAALLPGALMLRRWWPAPGRVARRS